MNEYEVIGKFVVYAILGALGIICPLIGYLELYENGGFVIAFLFFMINICLMAKGISMIIVSKE